MEYKIDGLTRKQVALLDIMWTLDDIEQVQAFIKTLPVRDRITAHGLMTLLTHEALEEILEGVTEFPEVQAIIERIR